MKLQDLHNMSELLGKLHIPKMTIESLKKIIGLQKKLKGIIDDANETQIALLRSYGISPDGSGRYIWSDHESSVEIDGKIMELIQSDFEVPRDLLNFMDEEEFYGAVRESMNVGEISFLVDFLKIE